MNFAWSVGGFPRCQKSWCGSCYTSNPNFKFHKNKLESMEHLVEVNGKTSNLWKRKAMSEKDYEEARDGDHLVTTFQCDLCIFRRILNTDPDPSSRTDEALLAHIRRANLDAFWSRARGTIKNNRGTTKQNIKDMALVGLIGPYYDRGPSPPIDHAGYETAIAILVDTKRPRKHSPDHKQWDSSRKVKSTIANFERATSMDILNNLAFVDDNKGMATRLMCIPTSSFWFQRFSQGCRGRSRHRPPQHLVRTSTTPSSTTQRCCR